MVITVTLDPSVNIACDLSDGAPAAGVSLNGASRASAGGRGIGVSRMLDLLGVENRALAVVRGTAGRIVGQLMYDEGLRYQTVEASGESPINIRLTCPLSGAATDIAGAAPVLAPGELDALCALFSDSLSSGDIVLLCGPRDAGGEEPLTRLGDAARENGAEVMLASAGGSLGTVLDHGGLMFLKTDREELSALSRGEISTPDDAVRALFPYIGRGTSAAAVTLGADGAVFLSGARALHVGGIRLAPLGAGGAGDCFTAGYIWGVVNGRSADECLKMAAACACARLSVPPSRAVARGDVLSMLERVAVGALLRPF